MLRASISECVGWQVAGYRLKFTTLLGLETRQKSRLCGFGLQKSMEKIGQVSYNRGVKPGSALFSRQGSGPANMCAI